MSYDLRLSYDVAVEMPCGCCVLFVRGDSNISRLEKPCTVHSKLDVMDQMRILREAEIRFSNHPQTLKRIRK